MNAGPIGVFDSGVGGLTVVRALQQALPQEDILYLGDTARVPYGSKSAATVNRYTQVCAEFLVRRGVKMLLIACNTASAYGLWELSSWLTIPVVDAVRPGAKAAVLESPNGHIAILGTRGTIASGAYTGAILELAPKAQVATLACPLLVPLAEEGWVSDQETRNIVVRYMEELASRAPQTDTVLLGCTHYPILRDVIDAVLAEVFGRPIVVVDSANNMALATKAVLGVEAASGPAVGKLTCFVTDESRFEEMAETFLGTAPLLTERVDL